MKIIKNYKIKNRVFVTVGLMLILTLVGCSSYGRRQAEEKSTEPLIYETSEETTVPVETKKKTTKTTTKAKEKEKGPWQKDFANDEFGRQTDECFLFAVFSGQFSNSATTNSSLTAAIRVERNYDNSNNEITDWVLIALKEYDYLTVKNYFSRNKNYNVKVLEENGNVIEEKGIMPSDNNLIAVWSNEDQNVIIDAMKSNKKLTFRIDEEDGSSNYLFEVDCTGFKELFDSMDWNV